MRVLLICVALSGVCRGGDLISRAPQSSRHATNPFQGDKRAAQAGEKLYNRECRSCHEAGGNTKAPSLDAESMGGVYPGALFWVLRNGSLSKGMPSFAHLPAEQRWQIIAYLTNGSK